jgi:hypothetical protein
MLKTALKLLVFAALIAGGVYARYGNPWKSKTTYKEFTVETGDIFANITSTGQVEPRNRLEVKALVDETDIGQIRLHQI